jgi:hypothetical protein
MKPKLIVLLASLAALAAWVGQLAAHRSWPDGL